MRIGASWIGEKEPDIIAPGRLRFYDRRNRTRIIIGARASGSIARNTIYRMMPGNGYYGTVKGTVYYHAFKYYTNIGAAGSDLAAWQAIFKSVMLEVKNLTEEQRAPYKAMEVEYRKKYLGSPGIYRGRSWHNFYLAERLPALYPGY